MVRQIRRFFGLREQTEMIGAHLRDAMPAPIDEHLEDQMRRLIERIDEVAPPTRP